MFILFILVYLLNQIFLLILLYYICLPICYSVQIQYQFSKLKLKCLFLKMLLCLVVKCIYSPDYRIIQIHASDSHWYRGWLMRTGIISMPQLHLVMYSKVIIFLSFHKSLLKLGKLQEIFTWKARQQICAGVSLLLLFLQNAAEVSGAPAGNTGELQLHGDLLNETWLPAQQPCQL